MTQGRREVEQEEKPTSNKKYGYNIYNDTSKNKTCIQDALFAKRAFGTP